MAAASETPTAQELDTAIRCVELSALAYKAPADATPVARRMGYPAYRHLARRGERDFAFVVSDASRQFVSFRGSDDRLDWLTNLAAWTTESPFGPAHRGYYHASTEFMTELTELVSMAPDKPVVLTGHSMGGALALLAALALDADGYAVAGVYTFGQPRTGGRTFNRYVEHRFEPPYYRFVHGADAIAAWGFGPNSLLGRACYFDVHGRLRFGGHLRDVPRLSLRFHRLEHYRFFLRLNRLKIKSLEGDGDDTVLQR